MAPRCICISVTFTIIIVTALFAIFEGSKQHWIKLPAQNYVIRSLLSTHFDFYPANSTDLQFKGRWLPTPDRFGKDASFIGSSLQFAVYNVSTIWLDLANERKLVAQSSHEITENKGSMILTPARATRKSQGPINIVQATNISAEFTYVEGICKLHQLNTTLISLNSNSVTTITLILAEAEQPSVMQLNGIWLNKGGVLLHPSRVESFKGEMMELSASNGSRVLQTESSKSYQNLVEVMAPASILGQPFHTSTQDDKPRPQAISWATLLEHRFPNTTISTLPVAYDSRLLRDPESKPSNHYPSVAVKNSFFRAGAPGTYLHSHFWHFDSIRDHPSALILILGLADVKHFLDRKQVTQHSTTQFTDELARNYSKFIQRIRRTAYSPSSLGVRQSSSHVLNQKDLDESYLYSSAPSRIPIFLLLHPIPSSLVLPRSREIRNILSHATSRVLNDLKWHIGDTKTFFVNTAGWLEDADFLSRSPIQNSKEIDEFTLTQSGHIKFANHIATHLCHYLSDQANGRSTCPFDRHNEYKGNMYVPEAANLGKLIEEKKVARMHEMFGIT